METTVHRLHVAIPTRGHLDRLPTPEEQPLLTIADLRRLGGSRGYWYKAMREDVVPTVWVGSRVFVPNAELRAWWEGISPAAA